MTIISDDDAPEDSPEDEKAEGAPEGEEGAEGEEGEGAEGEEAAKAAKKKKLIIIIAGAVVLLLGAGAGAYFTGMLDSVLGKGDAAEEGHEGEDSHGKEAKGGGHGGGGGHGEEGEGGSPFIEIPTMIVNLSTPNGTPRYLRLTVQLELNYASDAPAIEAIIPRVVDQFQTYLRELRVRDLRGSAGIYRLQTELLWRVNQAAAPIEVKDVLFQEILIQ